MGNLALAPGHAREYETIYVLRPSIDKDSADAVATRIAETISTNDGLLTGVELWGRRRLAYQIQRHHRGIYVYLKYLGKGKVVSEIERQLRMADNVIRYQTVQLDSNVGNTEVKVDAAELAVEFDLPDEADEPELSWERELGLDQPMPDRRHHRSDNAGASAAPAATENSADDAAAKESGDKAAEGDASATAKADAEAPAKADAEAPAKADAEAPAKADAEAAAATPAETTDADEKKES